MYEDIYNERWYLNKIRAFYQRNSLSDNHKITDIKKLINDLIQQLQDRTNLLKYICQNFNKFKITEEKIKIEEYEDSYIVKEFVNNSKLCIILKYNSVSNSLYIEKIIITKKYHLKVYLKKIESFDMHYMCNDILVSPRDKNVLEEYNIIFNKLEKIVDSNFYNKQNLINNILDSIYSENEKVYNNL